MTSPARSSRLGTANGADRAGVLGTIDAAGDSDYYAFYLNAGQYATIASYGLGNPQPVNLLDSSGNLIAASVSTPTIDGLIENFVATTSGWYYAQIPGSGNAGMSLHAWSSPAGADFSTHGNSFANAQNLDGVGAVLGAITQGRGAVHPRRHALHPAVPDLPDRHHHRRLRHAASRRP